MARVSKPAPTDTEARKARVAALAPLGIQEGQRVRFRRDPTSRWTEGDATAVEDDGSLALRDKRGRQRSIRIELVQARTRGPRGGLIWVPVTDLSLRPRQTELAGRTEASEPSRPTRMTQPVESEEHDAPGGHADPLPQPEDATTSEQLGLF